MTADDATGFTGAPPADLDGGAVVSLTDATAAQTSTSGGGCGCDTLNRGPLEGSRSWSPSSSESPGRCVGDGAPPFGDQVAGGESVASSASPGGRCASGCSGTSLPGAAAAIGAAKMVRGWANVSQNSASRDKPMCGLPRLHGKPPGAPPVHHKERAMNKRRLASLSIRPLTFATLLPVCSSQEPPLLCRAPNFIGPKRTSTAGSKRESDSLPGKESSARSFFGKMARHPRRLGTSSTTRESTPPAACRRTSGPGQGTQSAEIDTPSSTSATTTTPTGSSGRRTTSPGSSTATRSGR